MKVVCFGVLVLCALVAGDSISTQEIPTEVNKQLGPYTQQFVYLRGDPALEPSADDLVFLENHLESRGFFEDLIKEALEGFREVVINGNEALPPLDPLVVDIIGPYQVSGSGYRGQVAVNDLRAEGLRWYVVDNVDFNVIRLALGLHLTLPWLTVTGNYDADIRLAILLNHRAGGNFRVFIHRFEVGVNARLGTNLLAGHLLLRELDIKLDIHDTQVSITGLTGSTVLNNLISSFIQNLTQDIIQSQMANLSQILSEELFDSINEVLKNYTLADILG